MARDGGGWVGFFGGFGLWCLSAASVAVERQRYPAHGGDARLMGEEERRMRKGGQKKKKGKKKIYMLSSKN